MPAKIKDLTIFNKFEFKLPPVAVKFMIFKPGGMEKLEKRMSICEMLRECQQTGAFYAGKDNFTCAEPLFLGMAEGDPVFESGCIGESLEIFEEARANRRLYHYITKLERGSVNYVGFSKIDGLPWDPDVLVLSVDGVQLEIILRALCFVTGKMWSSCGTPVIACSWLLTYPYISGEVNFINIDVSHGMRSKQVFPLGTILVSIPFDRLAALVEGLEKIEWYPAMYREGAEAHDIKFKEVIEGLQKRAAEQ